MFTSEGMTVQTLTSVQTSQLGFRFIDLFAGIGGFCLGFEAIGGESVFNNELVKYARVAYEANFGVTHPSDLDIREAKIESIPDHEVLLAGFPCQPFSLAGVSRKTALGRSHGIEDETQGTLFFEIARILKSRKPQVFLLENVKNLNGHDGGNIFRIILQTFGDDLGYHVQHRVIYASRWAPQHRDRTFIIGFKDDAGFVFNSMPLPEGVAHRLDSILQPQDGSEIPEPPYTLEESGFVNPKYTPGIKLWDYLQAYARKHRERGNWFGFGLVGPDDFSRTLPARYHKDGAEILVRQDGPTPRRLTPRECARLMGFLNHPRHPDKPWEIPVSDAQAYRQFGNAVVPAVVEHIARHVAPYLQQPSIIDSRTRQRPLGHLGDAVVAGA